jgi:hypothetical protein
MEKTDSKGKIESMSGGDFLMGVLFGMACPYIVLAAVLAGSIGKATGIILLVGCLAAGTAFTLSRPVRSLLRRISLSRKD